MSDHSTTEDLADLYDNAPCGYLSLSPRGYIVKINRTLADWLQRREEDLLDRSIHEILTFGGKIAFETHLAPLLRLQGFVHELALDLVDAQGEKIPVIANAAERRGPSGEHLFTRLTMFKAVDRRTFERSLIEARIKAEEEAKLQRNAMKLRDQFMAVLGHDLRNPLAAIASGIRLLKKSGDLQGRDAAVLAEMERSMSRASSLIDDVLDFARGELGSGIPLDYDSDTPLAPVLEQVVEEMRAICPEQEFDAQIEITDKVDCDPERLGQLASNLLSNAATHGDPAQPIVLEAKTTATSLRLSVSNAGKKIPESVRVQLFQPFFRGNASESRQGLGLGLYIVNEIAKAHGGRMEVTSTDEETRFTFEMPREAPAQD